MAEKREKKGATNRAEAELNKAALGIAEQRVEHLKNAEASIMRAGYMLSQIHERISKGHYHLDDIIALVAVSSQCNSAAARVAQTLKTHEVQEVAAGDKPAEPVSTIITG